MNIYMYVFETFSSYIMDTSELQYSLRGKLGDKVNYIGILSSDKVGIIHIPFIRSKPFVFIANILNNEVDKNVMGHWVTFYVEKSPSKNIVFFDSYGINLKLYCKEFSDFIDRNNSFRIYEFGKQIQPNNSYKCGLYALFFVHYLSYKGIRETIFRVKNIFSYTNLLSNDRYVTRYYYAHLNKKNCYWWKLGKKRAITFKECKIYTSSV